MLPAGPQAAPATWRHLLAALLSWVLAAVVVLTLGAVPARASDGRSPTPEAELTALYVHGLDRQPDPGGYNNYNWFIQQDCRWGVLDASFKILNSAEAHSRWRNNPQDLAGMLYAALLDRAPDPGGLSTYTETIAQRGLPWSTSQMLASEEYNGRLGRMCAGSRSSNATMLTWYQAADFSENTLVHNAKNLAVGCAFSKSVQQIARLQKSKNGIAFFVGTVGRLTNTIVSTFRLDGTCAAVVTYLKAAVWIGQLVTEGAADNPVFLQWDTDRPPLGVGQTKFNIRIGPNPTSWTLFAGAAL
jgi:hypothetical protein